MLGSYRGGSNSSEHRNPKGRDLFALVVVTRDKHAGLGVGDGVMFLSRRAVAVLLWVRHGPSATTLSTLRSSSEKGLTSAQVSLGSPQLLSCPLGFPQIQCFLQVAIQRAGWKMPILLTLLLLQGESQTPPGCGAGKAGPEPPSLRGLLAGRSAVFKAASTLRTFYPWLSLPGSRAMQCVQGRVRSASRGKERGKSPQERANAGHAHF